MPWNIPNVNPRNNTLYLEDSAGLPFILTVPEGFYLPSELATAVEDLLNATATGGAGAAFGYGSWTVSWDSINNTFTIQSWVLPPGTVGPTFRILPKLNAGDLPDGVSSTLAEMMGFNAVGEEYVNIVKSSYASMLYTAYVDIQSDIICKNQMVRDSSTNYKTGNNILARIYICADRRYSVSDTNVIGTRPFHLWEEFSAPKVIQWNTEEFLPSANIKLLDDKGMLLYAPAVSSYIAADPAYDNDPVMFSGNTSWVNLTLAVSESI